MPIRPDLVSNIITSKSKNIPPDINKLLLNELNNDEFKLLVSDLNKKHPMDLSYKITDQLNTMRLKYIRDKQNAFVSRTIIESNFVMVKSIVGLASIPPAATGVGLVAVSGVNYFMDKLMEKSLELFDKSIENSSKKLVGYHLNKVREQTGKSLEDISNMTKEEAHLFVFGSKKGIMDEKIDFLTQQDKVTALHEMSKILEDKITSASALNKFVNENQNTEIKSVKEAVEKLNARNHEYDNAIQKMGNELTTLNDGVTNLNNAVEELTKDVGNNTENLGILKNYIYGNADLDGKIELLKSGLMNDIPSSEKEKLQIQLETLRAKQNLQKNLKGYLDKAKHITNILNNVGFDEEIVEEIENVVNIANVAMDAFEAYSSGNVLGCVSAASSLFGGGGKVEPAAQRHAETMNKLNIMDKKLDDLRSGQMEILQSIYSVLDTIGKLAGQIDQNHAIEMEKLHQVLGVSLYNRFAQLQLGIGDFLILDNFTHRWVTIQNESHNNNQFLTYQTIKDFYNRHGHRFANSHDYLNGMLNTFGNNDGGLHEFLKLESYVTKAHNDDSDLGNYIQSVITGYKKIELYIENFLPNYLASSINHTVLESIYDLECKHNYREIVKNENYSKSILFSIMSFSHLERVFNVLKEIQIFFMMQKDRDSKTELLSIEEFYTESRHTLLGLDHLEDLLTLVNIAVIQENLIAGDFLLEHFYHKLFVDRISQDSPEHNSIIDTLNSNRLLAMNFANYFVVQQLKKNRMITVEDEATNVNFSLYEYFLYLNDKSEYSADIRNPTNLRHCFDDELQSQIILHSRTEQLNKNKRWKLDLHRDDRNAYLILPNSDDFNNSDIRYRREMHLLLNLKAKIIDQISQYELSSYISDDSNLFKHIQILQ